MNRVTDFKPLAEVTLPGVGPIPCSGLTIVVGPNSAGKTHFLTDLYSRLCGEPRNLVVASDVRINKPEYAPLMECLLSEGFIRRYVNPDNFQEHIIATTTYVGTGAALETIQPQRADEWYNSYDNAAADPRRRNEFLYYFGRLLVTKLFIDRRLAGLRTVGVIDFENAPPTDDLHAFHVNDLARKELCAETLDTFGKAVWSDTARGTLLCLRVNDAALPSAEDRHSHSEMSKYRTIESEGDGLKSYVAICIALLLGKRPLCLVDEPEMCLHPPQAYSLGRFIGKHGSSQDIATFVATHSSGILRGVVQSTKRVEIIRLTRSGGRFLAHRVPAEELVAALDKPTLRAESVLDGLFSESVVVVEADGDRLVYNTTWETLGKELRLDVHFTAVGGTGGIADTCKLYRTLQIPVVVIADLDMVADPSLLRRVLDVMAEAEVASSIIKEAKLVIEQIRKLPPTVDPESCARRLREIAAMGTDWSFGDDAKIRSELNRLSQELDRMRRLKSGGICALPADVAAPLKQLVESLKPVGVFLAPVGELEGWLASEGVEASKANKPAWASAAAVKIQSKGFAHGDIWDFVREVGQYLRVKQSASP
jgi:hypothetical protein